MGEGAGLWIASVDPPINSPLQCVLSLSGNIPANAYRVSTTSSSSLVIGPEMGRFWDRSEPPCFYSSSSSICFSTSRKEVKKRKFSGKLLTKFSFDFFPPPSFGGVSTPLIPLFSFFGAGKGGETDSRPRFFMAETDFVSRKKKSNPQPCFTESLSDRWKAKASLWEKWTSEQKEENFQTKH